MAPSEFRRTVTMTFSLAGSFGVLVLIAVGTVLGIGLYSASQNTLKLMRDTAALTSELILEGVRDHLIHAEQQVRHIARAISEEKVPLTKQGLGRYLHGAMAGTPQVHALVFIDTDNQLIGVERQSHKKAGGPKKAGNKHADHDEHKGLDAVSIYTADYSKDAIVRRAVAGVAKLKRAEWGEVVWRSRFKESLINLRQPVRRNGKYLGMVVALVGVKELSDFLKTVDRSTAMRSFILQDRKSVVAHADIRTNLKGLSPKNPLPAVSKYSDPVIRAIWDKSKHVDGGVKPRPPLSGHVLEIADVRYAVMFRTITGFSNKPWIVGAYTNLDKVNAEVNRLITAGLFGFGVLLLAVIAALILGRRIARPVRRLSDAAEKIGALRLDEVEDLPGSRIAELNQQATAFNAMVGGLRWFEAYVPKALVRRLLQQGEGGAVRNENRDLTVLFTDIVGFSTFSEDRPAEEVANYLNDHFKIVADAIEAEGGTVDKFIGDSVMAFWGAPDKQKDRAERACRAAAKISNNITADNRQRVEMGNDPVHIRIGIHSGVATVGNIGSPGRINYTVVGDVVNVASRMEQLGKELIRDNRDVTVLITETTRSDLSDQFHPESLGYHMVKGREEQIEVFDLIPSEKESQ